MRRSRRLIRRRRGSEKRSGPRPSEQRRFPTRWVFAAGAVLVLAIVAALVAAALSSSDGARKPVVLAGDSVAVIDPETDTVVGEIPVGGRPTGPAVGEGSVWVGNRDDRTLLRIDPRTLEVVRTIGLGVAPKDVDVGAGSVWVLSDSAVLGFAPSLTLSGITARNVTDLCPMVASDRCRLSSSVLNLWTACHAEGRGFESLAGQGSS